MGFDLGTCDAAYHFVLDFMGTTPGGYITEKIINCENDFETFWNRNIERIKSVDISRLRLAVFHVAGSLDEYREIRGNGLMNLRVVLSEETTLKRLLEKAGVKFDILIKLVSCNGKSYDIDYEKYKGQHFLIGIDEKLDHVSHRIYYNFCVDGFMANDNVFNYGTNIHERPKFLVTLGELLPQAEKIESSWRTRAKSYRIDFYATADQVHRFNFELDEYGDPPYENWFELDDDMKLKKQMLSHAIDKAHDALGITILYIKDDVIIPANQIIDISELQKYVERQCDYEGICRKERRHGFSKC